MDDIEKGERCQALPGLESITDKHVSLGDIASTNLQAKHVIRRAYGYRDKDDMKLTILQVCTPWMGHFHLWGWTHAHNVLS